MAGTRFDWDTNKDAENQKKHGVSFSRAQYAFLDLKRVIAKDITHSKTEVALGQNSSSCQLSSLAQRAGFS